MRTPRILILVFLAAIVAVSCTVGPTLTPIIDPMQRLQFRGFSILPPRGDNWFMDASPINPCVPDWTCDVVFVKYLKVPATRPAEFKSVVVSARTRSLGDVKFESRTELLQQLARELLEHYGREPQSRFLKSKASLEKCLGWNCVRYEATVEDYSSRFFPGSVFIVNLLGFLYLHPDSTASIVALEHSQRYLKGEMPPRLEAEVEPFLKSLVFGPLR